MTGAHQGCGVRGETMDARRSLDATKPFTGARLVAHREMQRELGLEREG
jgi:hypothetical protein